jgi:hypothetical protein
MESELPSHQELQFLLLLLLFEFYKLLLCQSGVSVKNLLAVKFYCHVVILGNVIWSILYLTLLYCKKQLVSLLSFLFASPFE